MVSRLLLLSSALAAMITTTSCDGNRSGPVRISAIGADPQRLNPNLAALDAPSSTLLLATAQGLVRFDADGQIEPALAQSWIVSDDGLRYTFRIQRLNWENGRRVLAEHVVERLRAASGRSSRNPLKPLLGAIDEIEAMTDDVLEITLVSPRPNFLQLLAQPELAILWNGRGTGPYRPLVAGPGQIALHLPQEDDEDAPAEDVGVTDALLRGEPSARAVARFAAGESDLVLGGTAGDLPIARVAELQRTALRFDPASGLFGLSFGTTVAVSTPEIRRALSMAIDRDSYVSALSVPNLPARTTILPTGITELPAPVLADWGLRPLPARRAEARQVIQQAAGEAGFRVRVAMPDLPGYRLLFAHLRRDWRAIGVDAEMVPAGTSDADLHLVDKVARIDLATWYLRQFTCDQSAICDPEAERLLFEARRVQSAEQRQALLAEADRALTSSTVFIPLANPVRWSLVSARLTGFAPNPFAQHNLSELIAQRP